MCSNADDELVTYRETTSTFKLFIYRSSFSKRDRQPLYVFNIKAIFKFI
jgi:hypothetical protein